MAVKECQMSEDILIRAQKDLEKAASDPNGSPTEVQANLDEVDDKLAKNEKTLLFLEKLANKLELHFIEMDCRKKLEKRQMELQELESICHDFSGQLSELKQHLAQDIDKLEDNKRV
mmetsp:Transcript_9282/g.8730  ORF Transcript_9282/g.8730 Transcript_9282/m.8730 type:complete len:117 (-) Transcript_9282:212-562(-)